MQAYLGRGLRNLPIGADRRPKGICLPIKDKSSNLNETSQIARLLTRYVTTINQSTPSSIQSFGTISRPNPPSSPLTTPAISTTPNSRDSLKDRTQKTRSRNLQEWGAG